jgi:general secretion pathway protein H
MPTSAPGNELLTRAPVAARAAPPARLGGFTLLELLVVVAIIAMATLGVTFALRDSAAAQLDREGLRLAALLESARQQSRTMGLAVRWFPTDSGFRFDGLPAVHPLPGQWLSPGTHVVGTPTLVLGPEPIIGPQGVVITSSELPDRSLRVATDGLRPFVVTDVPAP